MNEHKINLKLVQEVEKHPILHDSAVSGYSRKGEKKRAWIEIGKAINMTAAECKERWKNIRAIFLRHMKSAKSSAGAKTKKSHYLMELRELYMKALNTSSGNLSNLPEQDEGEQSDEFNLTATEEDSEPSSPSQQPPAPSLSYPSTPSSSPKPLQATSSTDMFQSKEHTTHSQSEPSQLIKTNKKRSFKNSVDQTFQEYFETKRARMPTLSDHINLDSKIEGLKMFLLSMLPDLLKMSDEGVRLFKRKAIRTIDDILSHSSELTASNVFLTSSSMPSMYSKELFLPQDANLNTSELNKLETTSSQSTSQFYEAERNIIHNYFIKNMSEHFL